ncbi:hypothetical protein [Vibrio splendidus]|uniref:hypothetical protein n=1 Tax=Vibrio splendidus TaxID=29497 RepID=UPI000D368AC3|nr:hypothetical protein [Vibrio splendidus]PTP05112.1 hypothetical protein CWN86_15625 [Vibrio splendidus]PTP22290.1 hypothetical protein CWN85_15400 [Vibrio splendidus]
MAKEWVDVVDTAVKIGLGSLITGCFTYLGLNVSHKSDQKKFMLEHKVKVIEEISQQADTYFIAWMGVITKVLGITKSKPHDLETIELTSNEIKAINDKDQILTETWSTKESIKSKLRLLNANPAGKAFVECSNLECEIRELLFFQMKCPNYNEVNAYSERVSNAQRKFHKALAKAYDDLSS